MLHFAITPGTARSPLDTAGLLARIRKLPPVDFLLIREKHLPAAELLALTLSISGLLGGASLRRARPHARLLIARRLDVVLAASSQGIQTGLHLSAAPGELTPAQVRSLLPRAYVTVSCHNLEEVRQAREARASAILFAPVFGKVVEGEEVVPGQGLARLRAACEQASPLPVFALGGVTQANTSACQDAGAAGVAGIRLFFPVLLPSPA